MSLYNNISIHAPRKGSDFLPERVGTCDIPFQSTLPARGATDEGKVIFNLMQFQSTLPARGATYKIVMFPIPIVFQSTLPARGATTCLGFQFEEGGISIHAPRKGSDNPLWLR